MGSEIKNKDIEEIIDSERKKVEISKDIEKMYKGVEGASVDKRVLNEIAVYLSNGMEEKDIAVLLGINDKELQQWKNDYPEVMGAFEIGAKAVSAKVMLTKVQLALGGRKVWKQQAVKVGEYCDGHKIGEHIEIVEVWEELPPNYNAIDDILSVKESDTWNKKKILDNKESEHRDALSMFSKEEKMRMLRAIQSEEDGGVA